MITLDLSILNQKGTPMFYSDLTANRPTAGIAGRIFIATDSPYGLFRDTGSAWEQVAGSGGGGGGNTIYTANDTLTSDRVVSSGGFGLSFTSTTYIGTAAIGSGSGKLIVGSSSADNGIQIFGANSPSLRIDNAATGGTQRIVIGLSTATNNFIQGSAAGQFCISTASSGDLLFGMWQTTNAAEVMRITTTSNLLIGTTTDNGQKLQVSGTAIINPTYTSGTGTTIQSNLPSQTGSSVNLVLDYVSANFAYNNKLISFRRTGIEIGYFTADLTTPVFNVSGTISANTGSLGTLTITGTTINITAPGGQTGFLNSNGDGGLILQQSGVSSLRIFKSTGNVAIQTGGTFTDAGYKLDVNGNARVSGPIFLNGSTGATSGSICLDSVNGLVLNSKTGSTYDFVAYSNGGSPVISFKGVTVTANSGTYGGIKIGLTGPQSLYYDATYGLAVTGSGTQNDAGLWERSGLNFAGINSNGNFRVGNYLSTFNSSAILEAVSTTKGFLPPRMTNAQILAISSPATGLEVYNTDLNQPCFYDGTGWRKISHSAM